MLEQGLECLSCTLNTLNIVTNTNENKIKYQTSSFVSNDITGALVFR